jgi:hypothetical protein
LREQAIKIAKMRHVSLYAGGISSDLALSLQPTPPRDRFEAVSAASSFAFFSRQASFKSINQNRSLSRY